MNNSHRSFFKTECIIFLHLWDAKEDTFCIIVQKYLHQPLFFDVKTRIVQLKKFP